jgi:hypothetical protein
MSTRRAVLEAGRFVSEGRSGWRRSRESAGSRSQRWAAAGLSLGLDVMTLWPVVAAGRAWLIAGNVVAAKAAGQLSGSVAVNQGRVIATRRAFFSNARTGAAGATLGVLQTFADGGSVEYAIPLWGTGLRTRDAWQACPLW